MDEEFEEFFQSQIRKMHTGYSGMKAAWLESARRADKRNLDRISLLEGALKDIAEYAHDNSTGPNVPDTLWEIRRMAYDEL